MGLVFGMSGYVSHVIKRSFPAGLYYVGGAEGDNTPPPFKGFVEGGGVLNHLYISVNVVPRGSERVVQYIVLHWEN